MLRIIQELKKDLEEQIKKRSRTFKRDFERAFNVNSIDVIVKLKPEKVQRSQLVVMYDSKFFTNRKVTLIDCVLEDSKKSSQVVYLSYEEFFKLQDDKKTFKKLIKSSLLVIPPEKASIMLKNFGKLFSKFSVSPVINNPRVTNQALDFLKRKKFFKISKNQLQTKLCKVFENESEIKEEVEKILNEVRKKEFEILSVKIKATQGTKVYVIKESEING